MSRVLTALAGIPAKKARSEATLLFTRLRVDDEAIVQACAKGPAAFRWFLQLGNGFYYPLKGHGKSAPYGKRLTVGTRHRGLVQVRNEGTRAYLDGELVCEWKTDYTDVDPSVGYWQLRDRSCLGLGATDEAVFHLARVTESSGKGTIKQR